MAAKKAAKKPVDGKTPPKPVDDWRKILQQNFPAYSGTWTDSATIQYFGQDLIDLMVKIADPKSVYDLTTVAGQERVKAELRSTNYWRTTVEAARKFDGMVDADRNQLVQQTKDRIASNYGDLNLSEDTLNKLAFNVARNGLTGTGERQAVYQSALGGASGMTKDMVLKSEDANALRQLGRAYNFKVTDSQIESILTGTPEAGTGQVLTEDSLRQRMRLYVKGTMPHLAQQIDSGLTLEDIGSTYRKYAAGLLERDESQIDMFSGPYLRAFGDPKNGQLSLSDWVTTVKSDPTFGWQYTKQANDQATSIGLSLARAFGKVQ